jgi:radical SAM protein with 4Fe4S-binding SPASM domain
MITNGSLLIGAAEAVVASGLDELNVSLDGAVALHDGIRGMDGLFQKIMAGVKKVNEIKRLKGISKPLINIQCTITKYNCDHLEQMIEVAREALATSLTFHNLIFTCKKLLEDQRPYDAELGCSSKDWEGFEFEPGVDPEALYDKMGPILASKHPFSVDIYPNFSREELIRYYKEPCFTRPGIYPELPSKCLSPWIVAYVFPDGEVKPCLNCTYSFGNIKTSRFAEIWNSQKAVTYRRVLKKNGIFPLCSRCTELYRY